MEDFTKMLDAYRWSAGDSYTRNQPDFCASLSASPALATLCNAEEEKACSTIGSCSDMKNDKSANSSLMPINRRHMDPHDVYSDAHSQTNQLELKSCISDNDGDVGSQVSQNRYLSGSYNRGQKSFPKKKPRTSSPSRSSRKLVFSSIDSMDAQSDLKRGAKSKVKHKKSRKTHTKCGGAKVSSKQCIAEGHMPEFYDDSACEDGPIDFCSPDVAYSPGVASQHSHFDVANTPGLNKKKRCWETPIKNMNQHVLMNGKSPFFADKVPALNIKKRFLANPTKTVTRHVSKNGRSPFFTHSKQTPKSNNGKKVKNSLSSLLSERETAAVKTCNRRRREVSPIPSKDSGTINLDEVKEPLGYLRESPDWTYARNQNADSCEGAVGCLDSGVLQSEATLKPKTSAYFATPVKALGQRDIANKTWIPPISVYALIQEELYQDPWKVLVACMLLNKTCGTQMRQIIWGLFALCPTPEAAVAGETDKIEEVIRPLGLQKKRARMIQRFSKDYLGKEWTNVGQLHGIGKYATDAYAIFCEGRWQEVEPEDHKLVDYWRYLYATDGLGYAFKDDRDKGGELFTAVLETEN